MKQIVDAGLRPLHAINTVLLVGLFSAAWYESDLYRYCLPFLLLEGILTYYRRPDRPKIGIMGLACGAWGIYVGATLLAATLASPGVATGSAEGVYIFAMVYPTLGYAFYVHRHQSVFFVWLFMLVSLAALILTIDPQGVLAGERVDVLFHSNTIHASVGAGLILLSTIAFAVYLTSSASLRGPLRWAALVLSAIVVALCILGIMGAKSKGVWLALALTTPIILIIALSMLEARRQLAIVIISVSGISLLAFGFHQEITTVLAPNVKSASAIGSNLIDGTSLGAVVQDAIASGTVPGSFNERLMIWWNGCEIWSHDWLFGVGPAWEALWETTRYADVGYYLMHNGFLEIGIRYGLLGLAFYGFSFVWSLRQAWSCYRRNLINPAAFMLYVTASCFFLLTLLTNSNNRLAIGESFMLIAGAYGFHCFFLLQDFAKTKARAGFRPIDAA